MNHNHTITLGAKGWAVPMRVLSLINLFLATFSMVQCVLVLLDYYKNYYISMFVVVIYLLVTPFAFLASLLFVFGAHRIVQGIGADNNIIWGFAMLILLTVDNLVYIPICYDGASSLLILAAIELICAIILFLYYQGWGNRALAICGSILMILSFGYECMEAMKMLLYQGLQQDCLYLFCVKLLNTLMALLSLIFVLGLNHHIEVKK